MFAGPRKDRRGGPLKPGRRHKPSKLPLVTPVVACLSVVAYAIRPEEDVQALSVHTYAVHEPLEIYTDPIEEVMEESTPEKPSVFHGVIGRNQTITASLQAVLGLSAIHDVVSATAKFIDYRRSKPGDAWVVELGDEGEIARFEYAMSAEDRWEAVRAEDGFDVQKIDVNREVVEEVIKGTVESSLWGAFEAHGGTGALAQRFTDLFQYTIDFNSDTQSGDAFSVIYEKILVDGNHLRDGRILAAKYEGKAGTYYGFFHENGQTSGYFDADGDNLKRQFLKSPLATTRVTSNFGKRFHPVLQKMKMHAGVDYGAPIGTPVHAVADATVLFAGWKGANGKLVSLRHSSGYITHYAHLSEIGKTIKVGSRVKQKDVIGRVGNTGRSTGPHLHFGMTHNGKVINPLTVDFARAEPLAGKERKNFQAKTSALKAKL